MNTPVRPHSLRAWWLAARPKTLISAVIPVVVATAMAYTGAGELHRHAPLLALCCLLFAALMQVASNFINDRLDFLRGTDREDRLGPERACQQGWIAPQAMQCAVGVTIVLALLVGLAAAGLYLRQTPYAPLPLLGGLGVLGLSCVAGAFLYTTLLSRLGLGDVMVVLFFGLVPVGGTYFLLTHTLPASALWLGASVGLVIDTLLVVNNFRDRFTDKAVGKRTLVVLLGDTWGGWLYFIVGLLGVAAFVVATKLHLGTTGWASLTMLTFLVVHYSTFRRMLRIGQGRQLNAVLGATARNIAFFGLLGMLTLIFG